MVARKEPFTIRGLTFKENLGQLIAIAHHPGVYKIFSPACAASFKFISMQRPVVQKEHNKEDGQEEKCWK